MERKDPVTLSQKEQTRLRVISEVQAGRWLVAEAAEVLALSERHVRRLRRRFGEEGARVASSLAAVEPGLPRQQAASADRVTEQLAGKRTESWSS